MSTMTTTIDQLPSTESPESPVQLRSEGPSWEDFHALEQRLERQELRHNTWTLFIYAFAAIAVLFSIIGIGFGSRALDESKRNARAASAPAAPSGVAPNPAASSGPVALSEFQVRPASTTVAAGKVTFQITNAGKVQHELLVFRSDLAPSAYPVKDGNIDEEGPGITKVSDGDNLDPGASQTRSVDLSQPGTYLFVCNLPGHFKAGMYSLVTVR